MTPGGMVGVLFAGVGGPAVWTFVGVVVGGGVAVGGTGVMLSQETNVNTRSPP